MNESMSLSIEQESLGTKTGSASVTEVNRILAIIDHTRDQATTQPESTSSNDTTSNISTWTILESDLSGDMLFTIVTIQLLRVSRSRVVNNRNHSKVLLKRRNNNLRLYLSIRVVGNGMRSIHLRGLNLSLL